MLLIFFLVTTSMETDKSMSRQLPPPNNENVPKMDIDRRKVMTLHLMKDGKMTVNDETTYELPFDKEAGKSFRRSLKEFIVTVGPSHIIEVNSDPDASYEEYFSVENAIIRSYREIRDVAAQNSLGKSYSECNEEQRKHIFNLYPQRITETN